MAADQGNSYPPGATMADLAGVAAAIPQPETTIPAAESTTGDAGPDMMKYTAGMHQHPRLTSATKVTLDANGLATANFTRTFAIEPAVDLTPIIPGGTQPVILQVDSWVKSGAIFTGCIVKGYRLGTPTLAAVSVVGISVAVGSQVVNVSGVASGVGVSVIALQNSGS